MSLLAALAGGAAQGYAAGVGQNTQYGMQMLRDKMEDESKLLMDERIAERKVATRKAQGADISARSGALMKSQVEDQAQAVSGTPGASDFVRADMGFNETQTETANRDAARQGGYAEQEKESNDRLKDIETRNTAEKRHQEVLVRADAALKSADKTSNRTFASQERGALTAGMGTSGQMARDTAAKIQIIMDDINYNPDAPSAELQGLQADFATYKSSYAAYDAALKRFGGIPEKVVTPKKWNPLQYETGRAGEVGGKINTGKP